VSPTSSDEGSSVNTTGGAGPGRRAGALRRAQGPLRPLLAGRARRHLHLEERDRRGGARYPRRPLGLGEPAARASCRDEQDRAQHGSDARAPGPRHPLPKQEGGEQHGAGRRHRGQQRRHVEAPRPARQHGGRCLRTRRRPEVRAAAAAALVARQIPTSIRNNESGLMIASLPASPVPHPGSSVVVPLQLRSPLAAEPIRVRAKPF